MVKKVERWEAESGGYYKTEEEALEAELKHNFKTGFTALHSGKVIGQQPDLGIGSPDRVNNCADFVWRNREFIKELLDGKTLELKPIEEKKAK